MDNNNTQNPNFNRASTNVRTGGNKPDLYIQAVTRDSDGNTLWQDLGALWDTSKAGYSKGKLTIGDESINIVVQTRQARELALEQVRQRKHAAPVELDEHPHHPA